MFLLIIRFSLLRWLSRCAFSPHDFQTAKALLARLLSEQSRAPSPLPNPAEKPQTPAAFDSRKTTPRHLGGSLLPTTAEWVLDNGNSNAAKAGAEADSAAAARGLSETPDGFVELLGEAVYGGRLADDLDRRALKAILAECFSPGWFVGFLKKQTLDTWLQVLASLNSAVAGFVPHKGHPVPHKGARNRSFLANFDRLYDSLCVYFRWHSPC
jgi:hypothetical protein